MKDDPLQQFNEWFEAARGPSPLRKLLSWLYPPAFLRPDSMVLATASREGRPSARVVLFKGISEGGFVFYTNYQSRKGGELELNPWGALVFHWAVPERQVRVEGGVVRLSRAESRDYWSSRPRGSQLSAFASPQSEAISSREALELKVAGARRELLNQEIPCPEHWGGYRLKPDRIEFWELRRDRLHDRLCYTRGISGWEQIRLAP